MYSHLISAKQVVVSTSKIAIVSDIREGEGLLQKGKLYVFVKAA